jgi:hypothetical protein
MKTDPLTSDHAIITPWSENYTEAKFAYIRDLIKDADILRRFQNGGELPAGYGIGIDERCIEYPWFFAQVPVSAKTMLDAGSTLNHEAVVHHPALNDKELHILTLSPEGNCLYFGPPGTLESIKTRGKAFCHVAFWKICRYGICAAV